MNEVKDNVDTRTLNTISICSGYEGIGLGLREVVPTRIVCYVEIGVEACEILAKHMEEKTPAIDVAPIWTNLRTFDTEPWRGKVDLVTGGFPCQPFSFAGKREQEDDERNLWPDVRRIIDGLGVPIVFLENVPGISRYYWDTIRPELREMDFKIAEGLFTASETGAPHKRERLFILAHRTGINVPTTDIKGVPTRKSQGKNRGSGSII
jgi:DNA (cytosine-5)-methyltransferase 1